MADDNNPVFQIQRIYLKDLSLEIPHAPQIFLEQTQPTVEVALDTGADTLADAGGAAGDHHMFAGVEFSRPGHSLDPFAAPPEARRLPAPLRCHPCESRGPACAGSEVSSRVKPGMTPQCSVM